jgi:hypothetical protein
MTTRFLLTIGGAPAPEVTKISEITVRIPQGGAPQVSNFTLEVPESQSAPWRKWLASLSADPNDNAALEKSGTLEISDKRTVLLTLDLSGLGIARVSRSKLTPRCAGNNGGHLCEVELSCRAVTVRPQKEPILPGPGAKTVAEPPSVPTLSKEPEAPPGPPTVPAPAKPLDKGARDPEGAPRFEPSLRKSFAASRTKFLMTEVAEYATGAGPADVERFFNGQMEKNAWTLALRQEGGEGERYSIDLKWEREKEGKTARVTIGKAKDGSTTIRVEMQARIK